MSKFFRLTLMLALLTALLAFVAVPKAIGIAINEDAIDDLIALLPTGPDLRLEVEKGKLNRGWFNSTGTLNLNYSIAAMDPIAIVLDFDIDHGPLLFTDTGLKLGFANGKVNPQVLFNDLAVSLDEATSQLDINLSVFADFNRDLKLDFTVSPLNESYQDANVAFAGLNGSLTMRLDRSADARLTLASIAFTDITSNQRIEISNAFLLAKTASVSSPVAPFSLEFNLPSVSSSPPNQLTIQDLSFRSSVARQTPGNRITLRQDAKLGLATGLTALRAGQWHIEVSEINEESLSQFYAMLTRLQLLRGNTAPSAIRESSQLTQRLGLLLLNNAITISSAFDADAYDGLHRGELKITYEGLPQLKNIMGLNIREAIAASAFSIDLDLDLEAIAQSPAGEMLDPFTQEGYIVINNGRVKMNASLQNSIVQLNGVDSPVERFF